MDISQRVIDKELFFAEQTMEGKIRFILKI